MICVFFSFCVFDFCLTFFLGGTRERLCCIWCCSAFCCFALLFSIRWEFLFSYRVM
jgi:hypothetical protein